MTIKICCVGKLKETFFADACAEYAKRLSRYCTVKVLEAADEKAPATLSAAEEEQVKAREGERLLAFIDPKDTVIALTIGGKRYSSETFAAHLQKLEEEGARSVAFLIGGSLGLGRTVLQRADENAKFHSRFPNLGKTWSYRVFTVIRTVLLLSALRMFDCYSTVWDVNAVIAAEKAAGNS